ncbi:hypothetical protein [Pseudomonas sp.]|uniref:hypothetical protein n=1 Tax=Pseudomonas sp. TaxID=306 RepID=UPI002730E0A2|nr:hypothetical protein [Pseudomonas sp.]MDP2245235.1 hypothetical protein [Pseudomonas sp.]
MRVEDYLIWQIEDCGQKEGTKYAARMAVGSLGSRKRLKLICDAADQGDEGKEIFVKIMEDEHPFTYKLFNDFQYYSWAIDVPSYENPDDDHDDITWIYVPPSVFVEVSSAIIAANALAFIDENSLKRYLLGNDLNL